MKHPGDTEFYKNLKKPFFQPPKWIFTPVWSIIYVLLLISLILIINAPDNKYKLIAYIIFTVQMLLNISWIPLFFKAQKICAALIISILLFMSVLGMVIIFYKISILSGLLQIPYLLWSGFASILNFYICTNN